SFLSFVLVSLTQRNSPIHPVRYLDLRSIRASLIVALIRGSINLDRRPTASIGTSDLYDFAYRLIKGPQKNGFDQALWTTRMVIEHVRRKYGIEYRERGMRDVLHKLGFSSKKPRPTHYKAERRHWAAFKKMPARLLSSIQKSTNYSAWMSQLTA
ncbi:MAG: winged helix-turn-helix domain-containing protein, partial [Nitrososphaerales archaeon]